MKFIQGESNQLAHGGGGGGGGGGGASTLTLMPYLGEVVMPGWSWSGICPGLSLKRKRRSTCASTILASMSANL